MNTMSEYEYLEIMRRNRQVRREAIQLEIAKLEAESTLQYGFENNFSRRLAELKAKKA